MKDTCAVSVLVPICNVENYLRECLESLIFQTLDSLQIICIDDGSTDSSPIILEEFARRDSRVEVITKPNSGYGDSMNQGLARARGEYVGIVESDDFASDDMFEMLYHYAKALDLDMVKENFFNHTTDAPDGGDEYFDNLPGCPYGKALGRDDEGRRMALLMKPAIWSGLYRRSFLEEKGIKFLPTPGASFQDTSFHFKALTLAERVGFFPSAHLHYRIDNVNSSVASKSKAFFICEEYAAIWESVRSHADTPAFVKRLVPYIQFGGYSWNTDRLSPELQHSFYERFVEEYQQMRREGLLHQESFDEAAWADLSRMLDDPDGYFEKRYGPLSVDTTCVLTVNEATAPKLAKATQTLCKLLGDSCEIIVDGPDSIRDELSQAVADIREKNSRVFDAAPSLESRIVKEIPRARIRGGNVIALDWIDARDNIGHLLYAARSQGATLHTTERGSSSLSLDASLLDELDLPVFIPLLTTTFYLDLANPAASGEITLDNLAFPPDYGTLCGSYLLKDYRKARQSLEKLAQALEAKPFALAAYGRTLLSTAWMRVRAAFDDAPYASRDDWGAKPSASELPCFMPAEGEPGCIRADADEHPHFTVIIPVYNSQDTIAECLESVLRQTETSLQVICVDDGSRDLSLAILNEIARVDDRVQVIAAFNGGAGAARNRALPLAKGEFLAFIDSDDPYPSLDVLERLYRAARENDALICGGSFAVRDAQGVVSHPFSHDYRAYVFREEGFRTFAEDQFDYGWIRFVYHNSLFIDGMRFPELAHYEDPVFFTQMMERCPRYYGLPFDAYCYNEDRPKRSWTKRQVRDLLYGIEHNLDFAQRCGYPSLYSLMLMRLNLEYREAIVDHADDDEVFERLMRLQTKVYGSDYAKTHLVNRSSLSLVPCKEIRFPAQPTTAERIARRFFA